VVEREIKLSHGPTMPNGLLFAISGRRPAWAG